MERRIKRGKERVRKRERDDVWLTGRDPGKSRVVVFFFLKMKNRRERGRDRVRKRGAERSSLLIIYNR